MTGAEGVTVLDTADATLTPEAAIATTRKLYVRPLVSPVMTLFVVPVNRAVTWGTAFPGLKAWTR